MASGIRAFVRSSLASSRSPPRPHEWFWSAHRTAGSGWWAGSWPSRGSPLHEDSGVEVEWNVKPHWRSCSKEREWLTFRYLTSSPSRACSDNIILWQWWKKLCKCWSWGEHIILFQRHLCVIWIWLSVYWRGIIRPSGYLCINCRDKVSWDFEQGLPAFNPLDLWAWVLKTDRIRILTISEYATKKKL